MDSSLILTISLIAPALVTFAAIYGTQLLTRAVWRGYWDVV